MLLTRDKPPAALRTCISVMSSSIHSSFGHAPINYLKINVLVSMTCSDAEISGVTFNRRSLSIAIRTRSHMVNKPYLKARIWNNQLHAIIPANPLRLRMILVLVNVYNNPNTRIGVYAIFCITKILLFQFSRMLCKALRVESLRNNVETHFSMLPYTLKIFPFRHFAAAYDEIPTVPMPCRSPNIPTMSRCFRILLGHLCPLH